LKLKVENPNIKTPKPFQHNRSISRQSPKEENYNHASHSAEIIRILLYPAGSEVLEAHSTTTAH